MKFSPYSLPDLIFDVYIIYMYIYIYIYCTRLHLYRKHPQCCIMPLYSPMYRITWYMQHKGVEKRVGVSFGVTLISFQQSPAADVKCAGAQNGAYSPTADSADYTDTAFCWLARPLRIAFMQFLSPLFFFFYYFAQRCGVKDTYFL